MLTHTNSKSLRNLLLVLYSTNLKVPEFVSVIKGDDEYVCRLKSLLSSVRVSFRGIQVLCVGGQVYEEEVVFFTTSEVAFGIKSLEPVFLYIREDQMIQIF